MPGIEYQPDPRFDGVHKWGKRFFGVVVLLGLISLARANILPSNISRRQAAAGGGAGTATGTGGDQPPQASLEWTGSNNKQEQSAPNKHS
jgi:hypothetical protein